MPITDPFDVLRARQAGQTTATTSLTNPVIDPTALEGRYQVNAYQQAQQTYQDQEDQRAQAQQDAENQETVDKANTENLQQQGVVIQADAYPDATGKMRIRRVATQNPDGTTAYKPEDLGIQTGPNGDPYRVRRNQWGAQDWTDPYSAGAAALKLDANGRAIATAKGPGTADLPAKDVSDDPGALTDPKLVSQIQDREKEIVAKAAASQVDNTVVASADAAKQTAQVAKVEAARTKGELAGVKPFQNSFDPDQSGRYDAAAAADAAQSSAAKDADETASQLALEAKRAKANPVDYAQQQFQAREAAVAAAKPGVPPLLSPSSQNPDGAPPVMGTAASNYDTPLTSDQEKSFQTWKAIYAPDDSGADYDLRGAFLAGVTPAADNGHFPDTFKKPNHPTFSQDSQYNGVDGQQGGTWNQDGSFTPSSTNLQNHPAPALQAYFSQVEPNAKLNLPSGNQPAAPAPAPAAAAPAAPAASPYQPDGTAGIDPALKLQVGEAQPHDALSGPMKASYWQDKINLQRATDEQNGLYDPSSKDYQEAHTLTNVAINDVSRAGIGFMKAFTGLFSGIDRAEINLVKPADGDDSIVGKARAAVAGLMEKNPVAAAFINADDTWDMVQKNGGYGIDPRLKASTGSKIGQGLGDFLGKADQLIVGGEIAGPLAAGWKYGKDALGLGLTTVQAGLSAYNDSIQDGASPHDAVMEALKAGGLNIPLYLAGHFGGLAVSSAVKGSASKLVRGAAAGAGSFAANTLATSSLNAAQGQPLLPDANGWVQLGLNSLLPAVHEMQVPDQVRQAMKQRSLINATLGMAQDQYSGGQLTPEEHQNIQDQYAPLLGSLNDFLAEPKHAAIANRLKDTPQGMAQAAADAAVQTARATDPAAVAESLNGGTPAPSRADKAAQVSDLQDQLQQVQNPPRLPNGRPAPVDAARATDLQQAVDRLQTALAPEDVTDGRALQPHNPAQTAIEAQIALAQGRLSTAQTPEQVKNLNKTLLNLEQRRAAMAAPADVEPYARAASEIAQLDNPDQQALARGAIKLVSGRPLTADEQQVLVGRNPDGSPTHADADTGKPFSYNLPDGRDILTDAALARIRKLSPYAAELLPTSEQEQLEAHATAPAEAAAQPQSAPAPSTAAEPSATAGHVPAKDPFANLAVEELERMRDNIQKAIAANQQRGNPVPKGAPERLQALESVIQQRRDRPMADVPDATLQAREINLQKGKPNPRNQELLAQVRKEIAHRSGQGSGEAERPGDQAAQVGTAEPGDEIGYRYEHADHGPVESRAEVVSRQADHYRAVDVNDGTERTIPFSQEIPAPRPVAPETALAAKAAPKMSTETLPGVDPAALSDRGREAVGAVAQAYPRFQALFEALGVHPDSFQVTDLPGTFGMAIDPRNPDRILLDPEALADSLGSFASKPEAHARLAAVLEEEAIHLAGERALGKKSDATYAGIWRSLSPEQQEHIAEAYGEVLQGQTIPNKGREYVRMLVQLSRSGRTTEVAQFVTPEAQGLLQKIVGFLRDHVLKLPEKSAARRQTEALVKRIQGILDAAEKGQKAVRPEPGEEGSPFTAAAPAVGLTLKDVGEDFPVDPVRAPILRGTDSDALAAEARKVFGAWPSQVQAADGSRIRIQSPEYGSLDRRFNHLTGDRMTGGFDGSKTRWLPAVPETLRNAALRLHDEKANTRIYVRAYEGGAKHMVVVGPDGQVKMQKPFSGKLVTQFPASQHGRQNYLKIEWVRKGGGAPGVEKQPSSTPRPGGGAPDSSGTGPSTELAHSSGTPKAPAEEPNVPQGGERSQSPVGAAPVGDGFYSQLERTIEEKMPVRASAAQIEGILKGGGVKADEVKWSGLSEWLAEHPNPTKAEVLTHLRGEGAVQIHETTLSGRGDGALNDQIDALENAHDEALDRGDKAEADRIYGLLKKANDELEKSPEPRYAQYQLPGGENYREKVLSLPVEPDAPDPGPDETGLWTVPTGTSNAERSYHSSHFPDIPNYLAHMRLNDRVDGAGRPGTLIEELQSDRHQQGRDRGYRDENTSFASPQFTKSLVPDAPFRKTWHEHLFRRALRDAVREGKDWLGWTTGDTQNDRYDLSKHVSEVKYRRISRQYGGDVYALDVRDKAGKRVLDGEYAPDDLPGVLGKDLSQRITNGEGGSTAETSLNGERRLAGLDLKVGGEGMKGFYDKILPDYVSKYVKKWGGKVELARFEPREVTPENAKPFDPLADYDAEPDEIEDSTPYWKVDITPAMREGIEKGQPVFAAPAAEGPKRFSPEEIHESIFGKAAEKPTFREEVQPMIDAVVKPFTGAADDLARILGPSLRSSEAKGTANVLRDNLAQIARKRDQAELALRKASSYFAGRSNSENLNFIDSIENNRQLADPKLEAIAKTLRSINNERKEEVRNLPRGSFKNFIENYFPHIWEGGDVDGQSVPAKEFLRRIEGTKAFMKHRTIPTVADGIALGLKPVSYNPVDMMLLRWGQMDRYVAGQKILDELRDGGLAKHFATEADAPIGWTRIDKRIGTSKEFVDQVDKKSGVTEKVEKVVPFYAPDSVAQILNNHLSAGLRDKAWYKGITGLANVMNQAQLGFSAFHLGFTSYDAATSRLAYAMEQLLRGNVVEGTKALASVPVAPITNAMQGDKVLKEWTRPGSQGDEVAKLADAVVKGGGRVQSPPEFSNMMWKKMVAAFRRGTPLGAGEGVLRAPFAVLEQAMHPIMSYIVPRQKLGIFADLARMEMQRLGPGASTAEVRAAMAKAWDSVDNRLGQVVYDNLFLNKTAKDISHILIRSVGWNVGTLREIGGGGADWADQVRKLASGKVKNVEFTHRMAYTLALPLLTAVVGSLMQKMATGEGPQELKDYFFPRTGELTPDGHHVRWSLPSYMKDVYAASHDPGHTIVSKLHPMWSMVGEMIQNKDFYGTEIAHADDPLVQRAAQELGFVGKNFLPFAITGGKKLHDAGASPAKQIAPFFGITPAPGYIDHTPAENEAERLARDSMKVGTRTLTEAKRHDFHGEIRNAVQIIDNPNVSAEQKAAARQRIPQLQQQAVKDGIPPTEVSKAVIEARQAEKLTPLQQSFRGLTYDQATRVWKLASTDEKKALLPMMSKKMATARNRGEEIDPGILRLANN